MNGGRQMERKKEGSVCSTVPSVPQTRYTCTTHMFMQSPRNDARITVPYRCDSNVYRRHTLEMQHFLQKPEGNQPARHRASMVVQHQAWSTSFRITRTPIVCACFCVTASPEPDMRRATSVWERQKARQYWITAGRRAYGLRAGPELLP